MSMVASVPEKLGQTVRSAVKKTKETNLDLFQTSTTHVGLPLFTCLTLYIEYIIFWIRVSPNKHSRGNILIADVSSVS